MRLLNTFTPFPELNSIHKKICLDNKNFQSLSQIIFSQKLFKLSQKFYEDFPEKNPADGRTLNTNIFKKLSELFFDKKPDDGKEYIQVVGRHENERVKKFFRRDYVDYVENLDRYKIFLAKANGVGELGEIFTPPIIGEPKFAATETFISIGNFKNFEEAKSAEKFIKTKFCRAMLGILKITQDNTLEKWAKVPLQDFTASSDIDWSKSVAEIDLQLYKKYNLSAEEINFIESKVRAME